MDARDGRRTCRDFKTVQEEELGLVSQDDFLASHPDARSLNAHELMKARCVSGQTLAASHSMPVGSRIKARHGGRRQGWPAALHATCAFAGGVNVVGRKLAS